MVSGGPLRGTFDEHLGERRRVVITGVGAVTAAGLTAVDYWSALCDGRVCTSPLTAFAGAAICCRRSGRRVLARTLGCAGLVAGSNGSSITACPRRRNPGANRRADRVQSAERVRRRRGHRDWTSRRRRGLGGIGFGTVGGIAGAEHRRAGDDRLDGRRIRAWRGRACEPVDPLRRHASSGRDRRGSAVAPRRLERVRVIRLTGTIRRRERTATVRRQPAGHGAGRRAPLP